VVGQPRDQLPTTDGIFLGSVIEACWTKAKFRTTCELCQMLEEEYNPDEADNDQAKLSILCLELRAFAREEMVWASGVRRTDG